MKRKIIVLFEFIFIVLVIMGIILIGNRMNKNELKTENNLVLATITGNAILIDNSNLLNLSKIFKIVSNWGFSITINFV